MKKIIFITLVAAFALSACSKEESMGVSTVTTYATMTLNGKAEMFWPLNTPFVDPGCVAKEGSTDISSKITSTVSDLNVAKGGNYTVEYKVLNGDGFAATTSRLVHVYDATAPLNGYYQSKIKRDNKGVIGNRGPYTILVFGVGSGNYYVQSLLGGWYSIGSGYGDTYAGPGVLKLNADNTFTIVSASKLAWGYPCVFTTGTTSTYDALTKTIVLNTNMEDVPTMKFAVTLNNPTSLN
ncbi:MAG: BT_2262 family domain-containing protein [Paludibacter sp.]